MLDLEDPSHADGLPRGRGQSSKVPLRIMVSNSHFMAASH